MNMDHLIKTDSAEYRIRFVRHLKNKGISHWLAVNEFNGWHESVNDGGSDIETSNPELDADEALNY